MSFRTPMGRVRGLGSARDGTNHWWAQRLTAVALVPLTVWFVAELVALTGAGYDAARAWLEAPLAAVLVILLVVAGFHHAQLGLQVVIEDYVHSEFRKLAAIVVVKLAAVALGLAAVFAVLSVAFGG